MCAKLMLGWASRDITPAKPVNLIGQFHLRITDTVKDPVTLTALAVSTAEGPVAASSVIWISCDAVMIPMAVLEKSREKLKQRSGDFPVENLILNATHTHTAPDAGDSWYPPVPEGVMTPGEYAEFLTDMIAEAAAESWSKRKPGFMSWGLGYALIGHGRRAVYFDQLPQRPGYKEQPGMSIEKNARMYGNTADDQFDCIEGYVDHSTHFLFTFDEQKQLTGAVINLACTSQETEGMNEISADFWHEARLALRQQYGQGLFVLPQCSAAGGLSPHLMFNKKAGQRRLELKGLTSRQDIAQRIKTAFDETLSWAAKAMKDQVVITHLAENIELPRRIVTEEEYRQARQGLLELEKTPLSTAPDEKSRRTEDSVLFSRKGRCRRILARYEEQQKNPSYRMELHVVRLDDIALATNPFELFTDYGIRIQARSPATQTFVVQLCGGGKASYLPTRLAVQGESYSACVYCNEVGPEGGDVLVERTISLLRTAWAQAK